jgi:3-carboxy-cis,cis-muconate cycloisomerase
MLADSLFTTPFLEVLFSDASELRFMLAVEAALATAQAANGLIPEASARLIGEICAQPDWPTAWIGEETLRAGNPAIPFVNELKRRVAERDAEAARHVHLGATSQDVIDTALMLQLKAALPSFRADLAALVRHLTRLAETHGTAPMMGRTLLQHALPMTFGDKLAGWLDGLQRSADRLERLEQTALVVQLGGPVGTLAEWGERGPMVRNQVAEALGLRDAPAWHTQRDRLADFASALGILNGSLGKLANDVILLMQTEVNELRERAEAGRGGSSSMPHKRNPVAATFVVAIARQTPALVASLLTGLIQAHERDAGAWHAEWPVVRQLVKRTGASLRHAQDLLTGLEVDTDRMRENLNFKS